MRLFFDTSALIKNYIQESGSDRVDSLLSEAEIIYVSSILEIETVSTFKRLQIEKAITENEYKILKREFETDYNYFITADLTINVIEKAKTVIEKYYLKSLDAIHLAAATLLADEIDYFICCDEKLLKAAEKEGIKIINPNK